MSTAFYNTIIEDEITVFGIKKETLKSAARSVAGAYSRKALTKGKTFLDYNLPSNRCAYLYKYACIHTELVTKNFRRLIEKKAIKSALKEKKTLKICCLGGGPGTDIVGLFKSLASMPQYHKKIVEVTVLDICGGWRNSFKRIISSLIGGKVKDVPETFVNATDFKFKLIEVNLLSNLPANVITILSEADIVCMVKFVSAILGSSTAVSALQVIGEKLKVGAIVLFIDNFQGNVFKPFSDISGQIGLHLVLGPLHEGFNNKTGHKKGSITSAQKGMFGCLPLCNTRVTILGFIKSRSVCNNNVTNLSNLSSENVVDDDIDSWDTDVELEISVKQTPKEIIKCPPKACDKNTQVIKEISVKQTPKSKIECPPKACDKNNQVIKLLKRKHKFTQTIEECFHSDKFANSHMESFPVTELASLIEKLSELVNVLSLCQQRLNVREHSCHCHF